MSRAPQRSTSARSLRPSVEPIEPRVLLAMFVVTNTNDDTNPGSLRYAITQSNATAGPNVIDFDIASSGVQTIDIASALPTINVPVTIDGLTEPGTTTPTIALDGTHAGNVDGLAVTAGDTTIEGLAIDDFSDTAMIDLSVAGGDTIQDDFLGVDPTGTIQEAGDQEGVLVQANADNNTIRDNLISGGRGIFLNGSVAGASGTTTSGNLIVGNLIGTDITGTQKLGLGTNLAVVLQDASGTTIGGTAAADRNLLSETEYGVDLEANAPDTLIEGNLIGTDITGELPLGNIVGIFDSGNKGCTIGGTAAGAGNVISASTQQGVFLDGTNAALVEGNLIGTDAAGTKPLGNGADGIFLNGGNNTTIGGPVAGAGNVIAASGGNGITSGGNGIVIQGNFIGTGSTGTKALGNAGDGVRSEGNDGTIGGPNPQDGNVIANNGFGSTTDPDGVRMYNIRMPVLSNSIHDNQALGIGNVLYPGDYIQPAPVLTSAVSSGAESTISGTLKTAAGTYTLQFFATPTLDASGNAEGKTLLGTETLSVAGSSAPFSYTIPGGFALGGYITATATDASGDTSQFSTGMAAETPVAPSITASASSASVPAGQRVTDTFTIANPGMVTDTGIAFGDTIPAGTTFVSGTTSTGVPVTLSNGVATVAIGSIAGGQSMTVTIVLATSTAAVPSFTSTGGVTATTPLVAAGSDTASATTAVYTSADLSVAITPPAATTTTGKLTFAATVTNAGPTAASGATFTETFTLPTGSTIVSETTTLGTVQVSGDVVTATLGSVPAGGVVSLSVLVAATSGGTFADSAKVSSSTTDPNPANNSTSVSVPVRGVASVNVTSSSALPVEGDQVTLNAYVTVTPKFPVATKSVTFYDGTTSLGTAILDASGHASLVVALHTVGHRSLTAAYSGDANYAATTSAPLAVRVIDTPPGDYNGDGKSDLAVFDQTTATFTVLGTGGVARTQQLGNPNDVNIPFLSDITGAGRDDFAVYDQTAAEFLILYPGGGLALPFGSPRDVNVPVAGDFDGDGKTNAAIYDQTTATFYVLEPNGTVRVQPFGDPSHVNIPEAGDFDGDGKTDFAIDDQTTATFAVLKSTGGSLVQSLGNPRDKNIPVPGDFDGDGKTDFAVYDQSASVILAIESGGGTIFQGFGNPADVNIPVPGDFDGDGKSDIAIYDATAGEFLVNDSGGGSLLEALGNTKHKIQPL